VLINIVRILSAGVILIGWAGLVILPSSGKGVAVLAMVMGAASVVFLPVAVRMIMTPPEAQIQALESQMNDISVVLDTHSIISPEDYQIIRDYNKTIQSLSESIPNMKSLSVNTAVITRVSALRTFDLTTLRVRSDAELYLMKYAPDDTGSIPPRFVLSVAIGLSVFFAWIIFTRDRT
jgi:hypothetical protein